MLTSVSATPVSESTGCLPRVLLAGELDAAAVAGAAGWAVCG